MLRQAAKSTASVTAATSTGSAVEVVAPSTRSKPPFASKMTPQAVERESGPWMASSHICTGRDFREQRGQSESKAHCHFKRLCIAPGAGAAPPHYATRGHYDWFYVHPDDLPPRRLNPPDSLNFSLGTGPHQVSRSTVHSFVLIDVAADGSVLGFFQFHAYHVCMFTQAYACSYSLSLSLSLSLSHTHTHTHTHTNSLIRAQRTGGTIATALQSSRWQSLNSPSYADARTRTLAHTHTCHAHTAAAHTR